MAKAMSYEAAVARLEEIVARLESGEESLEDSLKLFEEGAAVSARCCALLDQAEQKLVTLGAAGKEQEDDN